MNFMVLHSRKRSIFVIDSYLNDSAFTAVKRDTILQQKVYERGTLFVKNGIKKGKGLDLGAEPPCITKFIIGQQTILPEPVLGAVYIGGRKILVPGRS